MSASVVQPTCDMASEASIAAVPDDSDSECENTVEVDFSK